MPLWDVVVIGLGAVGAAAMRAATERGARVLGLDLSTPAHDRASSHGHCRIFRHAYFEHPDYVPLLRASTKRFESLEREANVPLLHRCGVLLFGERNSTVVARSLAAAERHGLPVEALDRAGLAARFPWFQLQEGAVGVFEADAGLVRPEAAIDAALRLATARGAEVRTHTRVLALRNDGDAVVIATDRSTERARAVVVAAGAWAQKLLPELAPLLRVTRQVQTWIEPRPTTDVRNLPCWLQDLGDGTPSLYGIPSDPLAGPTSPARAPKVAFHGSEIVVDPDLGAAPPDERDLTPLRAAYERLAPSLCGRHEAAATCLYTMTKDQDFVVSTSREHPRVHFAAGLSGHGFKLSPVLGDALVDLALSGTTELPIGFLSPARFLDGAR